MYKEPRMTSFLKAQSIIWLEEIKKMQNDIITKIALIRKPTGEEKKNIAKGGG